MKKDVLVGIGEIGKPILKLFLSIEFFHYYINILTILWLQYCMPKTQKLR